MVHVEPLVDLEIKVDEGSEIVDIRTEINGRTRLDMGTGVDIGPKIDVRLKGDMET